MKVCMYHVCLFPDVMRRRRHGQPPSLMWYRCKVRSLQHSSRPCSSPALVPALSMQKLLSTPPPPGTMKAAITETCHYIITVLTTGLTKYPKPREPSKPTSVFSDPHRTGQHHQCTKKKEGFETQVFFKRNTERNNKILHPQCLKWLKRCCFSSLKSIQSRV